VRQHLLPALADGFGHAAGLEQPPVERRQEDLRAADVEGIRHGHHAAHAALQQRRGHGGEGVFGARIQHGRLAGVQDHGGHGVVVQQSAQVAGGFRVRRAVRILEDQAAVAALELVGR
jgi:hypothetical protein